MYIQFIEKHLDPDQELYIEVEGSDGFPVHVYLRHHDYIKIKKAFREYKEHDRGTDTPEKPAV